MERAALALVILLAGWCYFGAVLSNFDSCVSRVPSGYYGLLTAGFQQGHTYVALEPNPALLTLPDPYDPTANAPYRVHDISLWKGKYYLYFGVTPVLVLFWPFLMVTGWYPTESLAVPLFVFAGLCTATALLVAIRRRYFPRAPAWCLVLAVACLAFANPAWLLTHMPQFYQVPISCAFCLLLFTIAAIYRSLHSRRWVWWLALASLCFGLAVGARPNYLPSGLMLALAWAWHMAAERRRRGRLAPGYVGATLLAVAGPTFLCGCGLMLYNWLRFGSPTEFGVRYMLAGSRQLTYVPFSWENFWIYGRVYLFGAGSWSPYFPFFTPWALAKLGMLRYLPWVWLAPLAFLPLARGAVLAKGRFALGLMLAVSAVGNLMLLSSFSGANDRYYPDFVPAWLMLGSIGALALVERAAEKKWRRYAAVFLVAAAGFSMFTTLGALLARQPKTDALLGIARFCDWPTHLWQRFRGHEQGALRLELELPTGKEGLKEPLLQTGRAYDQRDWLYIEYLPEERARLGFFHSGLGTLFSDEFSIPASRRIAVETRCGSLLPPFAHPIFRGVNRDTFEKIRRDLQVKVDGHELLRAQLDCYESAPQHLLVGALTSAGDGIAARFSGQIIAATRLPVVLDDFPLPLLAARRPFELKLFLPSDKKEGTEPVFVTGAGERSDLLYFAYDGLNRFKLRLDHFGGGGPQSESITYDPTKPHVLTIWFGSLADPAATLDEIWKRRLTVLFDGRSVLNLEQIFYPAGPETAVFGFNPYGSTLVAQRFSGRIVGLQTVDFESLPPLKLEGEYGTVDLVAVLPTHVMGVTDPLVVTGKTGAGDLLYVRYIDAHHVMFGFDHWGVGGITGKPIEIDFNQSHRIEPTMGSLHPADADVTLRTQVRVKLDGQIVLEGVSPCHPASREEIRLLSNPIGGSTCGPVFNGKLLSIQRPPRLRD